MPLSTCHCGRVKLEIAQDPECIQLMRDFIAARPELWNEDIGV